MHRNAGEIEGEIRKLWSCTHAGISYGEEAFV